MIILALPPPPPPPPPPLLCCFLRARFVVRIIYTVPSVYVIFGFISFLLCVRKLTTMFVAVKTDVFVPSFLNLLNFLSVSSYPRTLCLLSFRSLPLMGWRVDIHVWSRCSSSYYHPHHRHRHCHRFSACDIFFSDNSFRAVSFFFPLFSPCVVLLKYEYDDVRARCSLLKRWRWRLSPCHVIRLKMNICCVLSHS